MQRQGKYPPPPGASDIPGLEVSGRIHAIGAGLRGFHIGDPVCAILAGGGYAELCLVPAAQVLPIPSGWTAVEAATLPENLLTVYDNIITRAQLVRGETLLVHGGASGIGSTAIMLGRAMGAEVLVTAGSDAKCAACVELGARAAINYKTSEFAVEVKKLTGGRGVDVILDMIGGSYLEPNLSSLAVEGRLAIIAVQGGTRGTLNILELMRKRARVMGSMLRARTPAEKGAVAKAVFRDIWPLLPAKDPIRPLIDSTFPLRDARLAHERLESGDHIGKVLLTTGRPG
jgi:NADPH2:quinone reductase